MSNNFDQVQALKVSLKAKFQTFTDEQLDNLYHVNDALIRILGDIPEATEAHATVQAIEEIWMDRDYDEILAQEETQRTEEEKSWELKDIYREM